MPSLETLLVVMLALAAVGILLGALAWHRAQRPDRHADRLDALAQQGAAQRAALEIIDQRLGHIQQRFEQDTRELRETLGARHDLLRQTLSDQFAEARTREARAEAGLQARLSALISEHGVRSEAQGARALKVLQDSMQTGFGSLHEQLGAALLRSSTDLGQRFDALTRVTDERLREIAGQVDKRLAEGFEKTTATFTDVIRRLALIDEAQKRITALSTEVVSLQQLLADKRSRGAFGEVQLAQLVGNLLPASSYALQHALPNGRIADCALFLPAPTGTLCIDAKFPLEAFRVMTDLARDEAERKRAESTFKQDIRKHIRDIAERYVIRNVTSDGAVMFIPAEAVFAEIQAHHPDLVDMAHTARVWLASPTTLWAILNTASSVLKDAATREQVDIIRQHLGHLAQDFQRFRARMDRLAQHIQQANRDVDEVNVSARKLSERFEKIERVEFDQAEVSPHHVRHTE